MNQPKKPSKYNRQNKTNAKPNARPTQSNTSSKPSPKLASDENMRIAKFLSHAGICSRRDAEKLIEQGLVSVNGITLDSPAITVSLADKIKVDGQLIDTPDKIRVFLLHKPAGQVTTHRDEKDRPTVFENLPEDMPRVISIGRLDMNTEGLLILTNNGELSRALELPATGWIRRYRARAYGRVTQDQLNKLQNGITIEGVKYGPIEAKLDKYADKNAITSDKNADSPDDPADNGPTKTKNKGKANIWINIALSEGKNREVRRVLEHFGLQVNRLIRVSYGPFQLGNLKLGSVKEIQPKALKELLPKEFRDKI